MMMNDGGFSHLFLATQWNLMCRSKSVQTLDTSHITCEDDSIGCKFYKTKTQQDGSGEKDPRHIYANPFCPITCWVTALGIYLACHPDQGPGPLFPGSNQKNRFSKAMTRLLKNEGASDNRYGTHSIRKGVATFACSGSTGGPSIVSVCLRCGWSLGGVQDRYLRYEAAGDQFLGRVVAGLPLNKSQFSVLPPHFDDPEYELCASSIDHMYPKLKEEPLLSDVLSLCLASLVYHSSTLVQLLPPTHPVLHTYIFREEGLLDKLKANVSINESPWMKPSGIPPHVEMYKQQELTRDAVEKIPGVVIQGVSNLIEEKGVAAGNITHDLLRSMLKDLIHDVGVANQNKGNNGDASDDEHGGYQVYNWGGRLHLLSEDFEFPRVDTFTAWKLWWLGNKSLKQPPYKSISTSDLSTRKKRKTYSEWKRMMTFIVKSIERETREPIPRRLNESQIEQYFDIAKRRLPLNAMTNSNRARRCTQIKMVTALRLIREVLQREQQLQLE